MSFQTPITIAEALENIEKGHYLLPSIQREFEWPSHKIEWLFDSLMRGYPISSFLFWNVENGDEPSYKFYQFISEYRQHYKTHNTDANVEGKGNFTAILDGQQRLTSLYLGLKGSYAYKEKHRHWNDDEWSVPTRHLYLNIQNKLDDQEEEDGRIYEFSFLKDSDTNKADIHDEKWFRVGKILELRNFADFNRYVMEHSFDDTAMAIAARLQEVIFSDRVINYFLEKEQDLHKALNIFIRINSGGKPLDFSDLIMSIAIANWRTKEARKEIHALVDRIQEKGFNISKDFIFKVYLYLYSRDIRFKVTNFSTENAHNFEDDWDEIRDAIQACFDLVRSFGFTEHTLVSKNILIPVIYYLYHRGIYREFTTQTQHKEDRQIIKKWIHVMSLKRIFGAGSSDGILAQIRRAFTSDVTNPEKLPKGLSQFPVATINSEIRRDTSVGEEFVEDLLRTQKDNRYAFSILALLAPHLDYRNNDFHKDHLHPISSFNKDAIISMVEANPDSEPYLTPEWFNSIINLQMLDANENQSKQDKPLATWIDSECQTKDRDTLLERCYIPTDTALELGNFAEFAEKRKSLLKSKLLQELK